MFVGRLNDKEKRALAHLLISVAVEDGLFRDAEREFLSAYVAEHGIDENLVGNPRLAVDVCEEFETPGAGVIALQELVKLAMADGDYDRTERDRIHQIAGYLEVSEETMDAIEAWVAEGYDWSARGEALINGSGSKAKSKK